MAQTKNARYRVYNGIDFDTIHLETNARQVKMEDGSTAEDKLTSHLEDTTTAHGIDTKARKGFGVGLKATLQNGWTTPTGIEYRKHEDLGLVLLKGSLKPGNTTSGTVILTLPKGYRPSSAVPVLIYDQMYGKCHVGMHIISAGGLTISHPFSGEVKEDSSIRIHVIFWTKE